MRLKACQALVYPWLTQRETCSNCVAQRLYHVSMQMQLVQEHMRQLGSLAVVGIHEKTLSAMSLLVLA